MKSGVLLLMAAVFPSMATSSDPLPQKERFVECRGVEWDDHGRVGTAKEKPWHQVFKITDEYVQLEGWKKTIKLLPEATEYEDQTRFKYTEGEVNLQVIFFKKTGRAVLYKSFSSGDNYDKSEGDCKKFVPSDVFQ